MSLLLNTYSVDCVSELLFDVTFSIPNNCDYIVATAGSTHNITIQLKPGQTKPSKVFVADTIALSADATTKELNVQFIQILGGTTSMKPKVTVIGC